MLHRVVATRAAAGVVGGNGCVAARETTVSPVLRELCSNVEPGRVDRKRLKPSAAFGGEVDGSETPPRGKGDGRIEVIFGPMFAGKTTELLRRCTVAEAAGRRVMVLKSATDKRYSISEATTHDGKSRPCFALPRLSDVAADAAAAKAYASADVVAIDEGQFFEDLLSFCVQAANRDGKEIIVAGLDGDFRRRRFGEVLDLIPHADEATKLTARCARCNNPGIFSLRLVDETDTTLIGGKDKYLPVCRKHYCELDREDCAELM